MKYKFYKRENRQVIPVTDKEINKKAIIKLKLIFEDTLIFNSLPLKFQENFDDVSLFHPAGDIEKSNAILLDPE